ncbi:MAG: hypothetical protein AVDCRST_MAG88-2942, partial [uncultured Thermomicrobiales bacterium]
DPCPRHPAAARTPRRAGGRLLRPRLGHAPARSPRDPAAGPLRGLARRRSPPARGRCRRTAGARPAERDRAGCRGAWQRRDGGSPAGPAVQSGCRGRGDASPPHARALPGPRAGTRLAPKGRVGAEARAAGRARARGGRDGRRLRAHAHPDGQGARRRHVGQSWRARLGQRAVTPAPPDRGPPLRPRRRRPLPRPRRSGRAQRAVRAADRLGGRLPRRPGPVRGVDRVARTGGRLAPALRAGGIAAARRGPSAARGRDACGASPLGRRSGAHHARRPAGRVAGGSLPASGGTSAVRGCTEAGRRFGIEWL